MRKLFRAIAKALKAAFGGLRWTLEKTAKGIVWVASLVPSFGGGSGAGAEPAEEDVSEQATAQAQAEQERAEAADELRGMANAVRKVAQAIAAGREPDPEYASRLRPTDVAYLRGLTPDEAKVFARNDRDGIRLRKAFVEDGALPQGVRSVLEVQDAVAKTSVSSKEAKVTKLADKIRARRLGLEGRDPDEVEAHMGRLIDQYKTAA